MANGIVLNIDTTKSEFQNPMVELRQGDGNYQSLSVTVTSNGEPFDLTGWTITFMGTTAGGFKIVDSAVTVKNALQGSFTYTPTKAWGQDQGEFKNAYFKFTKSEETASGASFRVNVLDAVDLTAEEAGDYISIVDQTISKLNGDLSTLQRSVNDLKSQNNAIKTTDNTWTGKNTFTNNVVSDIFISNSSIPRLEFKMSNSTVYTSRIAELIQGVLTINGITVSGNTVTGNLTGNASTATKLQTSRTINGTAFDGTSNISVNAANDSDIVHKTGTETVSGSKTFTSAVTSDFFQSTASIPRVDFILPGNTVYTSRIAEYTKGVLTINGTTISQGTVTGKFVGNGDSTIMSGSYGLRVTSAGIQKTSNGGTTWVNI